MTIVQRISAKETIAVRWPILRPGFPSETAVFDGDHAPSTIHFGAFQSESLVGVASIYAASFPEKPELKDTWQLRGMATLPEVRGKGLGRALLRSCEEAARESGATLLWCNARVGAVPFYARHDWQTVGAEFDIPTVGPHYRMLRELG